MIVAIIGVGAMGEAILAGMLGGGWSPGEVRASTATEGHRQRIADKYGVAVGSAKKIIPGANVVIIAVKPHVVAEVLTEIAPVLDEATVVVSVAAGLSTTVLESSLPTGQPVVRAMPNIASIVGEGMTAMSPGTHARAEHLVVAAEILSAVGQVVEIDEKQMDAVTAISGSGPAYVMYVAEAMTDAAVLLGLPRALGTQLVNQTLFGASKILVDSEDQATVVKNSVTSPGGTTIAALAVLERRAVKAAIIDAAQASHDRSIELGQQ